MDCVNHSGVNATAFCQNCGKPLCQACVKTGAGGQIFCEPCWMAWNGGQQPFVAPPVGGPNPVLAAMLGLIPGVGAMYNGQLIKGLIHVLIFAVLVSAAHVYGIFGLFIAGWVCYQVFEAYHTAKARRDGEPLPDPLGLNELTNLFGAGGRMNQGMPPVAQPGSAPGPVGAGPASPYQAPESRRNMSRRTRRHTKRPIRGRLCRLVIRCRIFRRFPLCTGGGRSRLERSFSSPWVCCSCWATSTGSQGACLNSPGRFC